MPAPWGRLCGCFPFSSPKYREPNPETWCHVEERALRHPSAWASSSEGLSGAFAKDPWEEASDASACAINRCLQKWGRACPPSWRALMSSYWQTLMLGKGFLGPALVMASCWRAMENFYLCSAHLFHVEIKMETVNYLCFPMYNLTRSSE